MNLKSLRCTVTQKQLWRNQKVGLGGLLKNQVKSSSLSTAFYTSPTIRLLSRTHKLLCKHYNMEITRLYGSIYTMQLIRWRGIEIRRNSISTEWLTKPVTKPKVVINKAQKFPSSVTVSRKIYEHTQSKSYCFQVQPVHCCDLSGFLWGIFHRFLSNNQ